MRYTKPELLEISFTCPTCHTLAEHSWRTQGWENNKLHYFGSGLGVFNKKDDFLTDASDIAYSICKVCNSKTVWVEKIMVFPNNGMSPPPNNDMPKSVRKIYDEAASISGKSPRAAAALLRLGIQILMKELGESGNNINKDIGSLVQKGLNPQIQQALDTVRVIGNEAVHPGTINTDDESIVSSLFMLINIIVQQTITNKIAIEQMYSLIPQEKLKGIEKRDTK